MRLSGKRDNRGLSLVELIIVLAIMAVLTGAVSIGVNLVTNKAVDKCATQLKASIQSARVTTMGKFRTYLRIYMTTDGVCIEEIVSTLNNAADESTTDSVKQVFTGDANVTVRFQLNDGSWYPLGDASNPLILEFDRSSGALKQFPAGSPYAGKYCVAIEIRQGSRIKPLKLAYLTGKVTME